MNITVYLGANEGSDPALGAAVRALGHLSAPCILYDLNGYYESLRALLGHMVEMGLSTKERQAGIYFAQTLPQIQSILAKRQ